MKNKNKLPYKSKINNNQKKIEWVPGSNDSNIVIENKKLNVQLVRYKIVSKDSNIEYDTIGIREPADNSVIVVENQNNEIGLVYEWRPIPEKWFWACIRGFAKKKDKNRITIAKRELLEEIGIKKYSKIIDLGIYYQNTAYFENPTNVILIKVINNLETKLEKGILKFKFFPKEQIYQMIHNQEIICQHTLSALFKYFIYSTRNNKELK